MRHTIPIEDLLLLLSSDAIVLVKEIKERAFRFLERSIGPSFQVSQIRKDALLEFFGILDRTAKGLESECQAPNDIGT